MAVDAAERAEADRQRLETDRRRLRRRYRLPIVYDVDPDSDPGRPRWIETWPAFDVDRHDVYPGDQLWAEIGGRARQVEVRPWRELEPWPDDVDEGPELPALAELDLLDEVPVTILGAEDQSEHLVTVGLLWQSLRGERLEDLRARAATVPAVSERTERRRQQRHRQLIRKALPAVDGNVGRAVKRVAERMDDEGRWRKVCPECHGSFTARRKDAHYCSSRCAKRAARRIAPK